MVLSAVWIGLIIGVSFIATPVKFRAPSITTPIAVDIGRVTFGLFGRIEAVLALVLLVGTLDFSSGQFKSNEILFATLCAGIVAFQLFWLRPFLDHRVGQILNGEEPPKSQAHKVYVGLELAKLVALAGVAVGS